jgi:HEAT repeat protein
MVRSNARSLLGQRFEPPSWADALAGEVGFWVLLSFAPVRAQFLAGAVDEAARAGIHDRPEAFLLRLHAASPQDKVVGVLGLGEGGHRELLPELRKLEHDDDDRVRVAVAWARILLGDRQGYDSLHGETLLASDAAVHAVDVLRSLRTKESLNSLAAATKSPWPAARALAAAGLRERRKEASAEVDRLLAGLQRDPEEMVRVAASLQ